ncbi:uncharacterized protein LOC144477287 isoform X2 [Augochlora pura]
MVAPQGSGPSIFASPAIIQSSWHWKFSGGKECVTIYANGATKHQPQFRFFASLLDPKTSASPASVASLHGNSSRESATTAKARSDSESESFCILTARCNQSRSNLYDLLSQRLDFEPNSVRCWENNTLLYLYPRTDNGCWKWSIVSTPGQLRIKRVCFDRRNA